MARTGFTGDRHGRVLTGHRRAVGVSLLLLVVATVPPVRLLPAPAEASADAAVADPGDWPSYNHDVTGSRTNPAETVLGPATAGDLAIRWRVLTPAAVHGTPAVVDGVVYVGDGAGNFYALDADDGTPHWVVNVGGPITATALVTPTGIFVGDLAGMIHGLDRATGAPLWPPVRPNPHPASAVYGSAILAGGKVVVGISSNEEFVGAGSPVYPCCSFRGSVVALDPASGAVAWQAFMISAAESEAGSSGAGVWATPTYDAGTDLLYVTTGNNYSDPATATSDAVVALSATSGQVAWVKQLYPNDVWNWFYPPTEEHPDYDFGDSAQIFQLRNGRTVVGAGQKSGFFHVLDAQTGRLVDNLQVEPGGHLGGLFADSAVSGGVAYANGSDWRIDDINNTPFIPGDGDLVAIRSDHGRLDELWRVHTAGSPNLGGVAVANGVVYFHASRAGVLYAVDASTGAVLTTVDVGIGMTGPSVSRGRVYLGTGDLLAFIAYVAGGSIVCLGLPES